MMKKLCCFKPFHALAIGLALALFLGAAAASAEPWKFGVMSDTQWPTSPDNKNPNVAVNVINHINKKFIDEKVKFVIQVGDLTDVPGATANPAPVGNLDIRATFAQDLYNAGIGFYPLRGNHEDKPKATGGTPNFYGTYAREFQRIFPQTQTGINNLTPVDAMINSTIYGPQSNTYLQPLILGTNFASEPSMKGLTYSFDYENARFVLIDQFTKPDGTSHANLDITDVNWIANQFSSRPAHTHAFSFAHKGLITENHADNLFNSTNPTASQDSKDLMETFMMHLQNNDVRYHLGGHDHMHNRAIVSSPNTGNYKVQNIITSSNSYKFYIPPYQSLYNTQSAFRNLETPIAQEIFTVGYYIFTVDGPKVTVDYYAMPNGCGGDCDQTYDVIPYEGNTPTSYNQPNGPGSTATSTSASLIPTTVTFAKSVPFTKHETFGYSLNGKEIPVPQGSSYTLVVDDTSKAIANGEKGYLGTKAAILSGTNGSTGKDYNLRPLTKSVNTGWAPKKGNHFLASDIFTLWGMADSLATKLTPVDNLGNKTIPQYIDYTYVEPNTDLTDTYVLSMTYDHHRFLPFEFGMGLLGLATRDENGDWVNAVDMNFGGTEKFVLGPYKPGYKLGTYGIDLKTHTAWAVINYNGDFAVTGFRHFNK